MQVALRYVIRRHYKHISGITFRTPLVGGVKLDEFPPPLFPPRLSSHWSAEGAGGGGGTGGGIGGGGGGTYQTLFGWPGHQQGQPE